MKKVFIILYVLLVIFITICIFCYNEKGVTILGNKALIIVSDFKFLNTSRGDLVVVDVMDETFEIGDYILYYDLNDGIYKVKGETIKNVCNISGDLIYTLDNNVSVVSKDVISKIENASVYPFIGNVLAILESKWGYFFVVVLPIFIAFIYEILEIIKELIKK